MKERTFMVETPSDFEETILFLVEQIAKGSASLLCLSGDLGAGKTTFVQQLATTMRITDTVTSPTFGIIKSYAVEGNQEFDQLVHIDAYRIEDITETGPLRLVELLKQPRTLICLEWPEKITEILPDEKITVRIEIDSEEKRTVTVCL